MITAFSINTFSGLPMCTKLFEGLFSQMNGGEINIFHCKVSELTEYSPKVKAHPILSFPSYNLFMKQSMLDKIKKYFSIAFYMLVYSTSHKTNFFYVIDLYALFCAVVIKKYIPNNRLKIVYHQFEIEDTATMGKLNNFFFKFVTKNIRHIDIGLFPEVNRLNYFKLKTKIENSKCFLFPNTTSSVSISSEISIQSEKIIFAHIGAMGKDHYGLKFIDAFAAINSPNAEFWLIGTILPEVKQMIKDKGLENVKIIGQVPHKDLKSFYNQIDYGLILYKPISLNNRYCAPNKLYEMWSNGIKVIGPSVEGLRPLFKTNALGKLINMDNIVSLRCGLEEVINIKPSREDRINIIAIFNCDFSIEQYIEKLSHAINENLKQS